MRRDASQEIADSTAGNPQLVASRFEDTGQELDSRCVPNLAELVEGDKVDGEGLADEAGSHGSRQLADGRTEGTSESQADQRQRDEHHQEPAENKDLEARSGRTGEGQGSFRYSSLSCSRTLDGPNVLSLTDSWSVHPEDEGTGDYPHLIYSTDSL